MWQDHFVLLPLFWGGAHNSKWCIKSAANKFDLLTKWACQNRFHFVHVEYAMFVHQKTHCRQKLAEGRVRLLGGKPGDRSLGLPGNLVGFMPQSTRWCPPCHNPPGSLWGSEWGWGVSSSSHNQLLLLLKTKDYNEKHELFAASSWNSPSQKRSPTLGDSYTWPEIRWWLYVHIVMIA